jgi:sugar phosphate isomerase/epimerase
VVTTHIHDNNGEKDEHLLPYEGTINWDAAVRALAGGTAAPELPFVLELKDQAAVAALDLASVASMLHAARAVFDKFELALSNKPAGSPNARPAPA